MISKEAGAIVEHKNQDRSICDSIEDAEDKFTDVVLLEDRKVESLSCGQKPQKKAEVVSNLQGLHEHQRLESNGEAVASMVKHEAERAGVTRFAGLLSVHFIQDPVGYVGKGLEVAPPGADGTLKVVSKADEKRHQRQKGKYES